MVINWASVQGFSKAEFRPPVRPGTHEIDDADWDMQPGIIDALGLIRVMGMYKYGKFRVIIHANGGYAVDGHSKGSFHYKGRASDFHMEHFSAKHECWALVPWIEQMMILHNSVSGNDYGVGLHPNWINRGFHLDHRLGVKAGAVWWQKDGKYQFYKHEDFGMAVTDVLRNQFRKGEL